MFIDVPVTHFIYETLARFLKMKAVSGYPDGTFKPDKNITRAETIAFIDKHRQHAAELVKALTPSVVTIKGRRSDGTGCLGSGVVLDKNGHIATNVHVAMDGLEPWDVLEVFLDPMPGAGLRANVRYGDFGQDIAILKITASPIQLQPVEFAESVELLDECYCMGNPLGYIDSTSKGVVSSVKRIINGTEWIQTDAAVNPGNSGGGAFNYKGELIGLPTFVHLWADSEMTIPINNVGFITPWYKVKEIYQKALAGNVAFTGTPIHFSVV